MFDNSHFSAMNRPPPPPPQPTAPFPPPPPSVTNALSDLKSLIHLSSTSLRSLPPPIYASAASTAAAGLVPCPINPNHRLPPSSLFSHYLNCPSPLSLPHTFHYPLNRASSSSAAAAADSSELTVSLEDYIDYNAPANSFFYQNCPGPVTPANPPPSSFNLPRVLYTQCADFIAGPRPEAAALDFIRFLPSEIWAIRGEIESWGGGFPAAYSSRVLRAILKLRDCKLAHLCDWIIANSPRYGVVIDCAMRDHVVLLVKLSLKVIVGEALELAGFTSSDGEMKKDFWSLGNRSFECPILGEVMVWLALQLSILYGEASGKYFGVDLLKECILNSASRASLFSLEGNDDELSEGGNVEEKVQSVVSVDNTQRAEIESIECDTVGSSSISTSQVAAAVAALHERAFVEDKIKTLRNPRPTSTYQRNMEHALVSKIADEERQKRPDYRPVIEYDSFLRHRSSNQDANRVKTKEELLAEERDYKRRRMSYRGKKLKRNTVEVMRGIIEEYMEELRQTEGIGAMSKAVEENENMASENMDRHARENDDFGTRRNSEIPEDNRGRSADYRKDTHSRHYAGDFEEDNRQDSSWNDRRQYSNRSHEGNRYDRDDSPTRDGRRISSHSRAHIHGREKSDFVEAYVEGDSRRSHERRSESRDRKYYKDEHEQKTHKRRRDEHDRSNRKRERAQDYWEHEDRERSKRDRASRERDEDRRGHAERRKSKTNRSSSSSSSRRELHEIDDRYDPAGSSDMYGDDY